MEESKFYKIIVQETSYGDFSESTADFNNLIQAKCYLREIVKQYLEIEDGKLARVKIMLNIEDSEGPLEPIIYFSLDFYEGWHKIDPKPIIKRREV